MSNNFECFLCKCKFTNEKSAISHLKLFHFIRDNITEIKCLRNCNAVFYTFDQLKKHLKKCVNTTAKPFENEGFTASVESVDNEFKVFFINGVRIIQLNFVSFLFKALNIEYNLNNGDSNFTLTSTANDINENESTTAPKLLEQTEVSRNNAECQPLESECSEYKMKEFLNSFNDKLCGLALNHSQTTEIFSLCADLVNNMYKFNRNLILENNLDALSALELSTKFVSCKLDELSTRHKRDRQLKSKKLFVTPQELAVGLRYNVSKSNFSDIAVPRLIQCKFHYISITQSIISLFQREDFRKAYFEFNDISNRESKENVYVDFSSGTRFKNSELFANHPESLQIELATDDFDLCNAIGSKATIHKLCPVYFSIKNIPPKFTSKLNSISVASLCYSNDLNTMHTDFNNIWQVIVKDIAQIENGIDIGDRIIKGTVTFVASDNLGANTALGFVRNFSKAKYCCRFCTCSLPEMRTLCHEVPSKNRTIEHYDEQITLIENSTKFDWNATYGIERYCVLNDLKYFNIIDGMVPDIMHDIDEGVVPFALKCLFGHLINKNVFAEKEIKGKIDCFDYGWINRKNVPTNIGLQKKSLGLNAMQVHCLFQNIPFIFFNEKNHSELKAVWDSIESLLKIKQIIDSTEIHEEDLRSLEFHIEMHLKSIQINFKSNLLPKHHFLTHYVKIIRANGPLKAMSMLRFEAKHKQLKSYAEKSENFINITKTITDRHQNHMCTVDNIYTDHVEHGKRTKKLDLKFFDDWKDIFQTQNIFTFDNILETPFLKYNIYDYRKGMLIFSENSLFEIYRVLVLESDHYFACVKYEFIEHDSFLNSIEIKKCEPHVMSLKKFSSLENKSVFEIKKINNKLYIILTTLSLKSLYCL